MSKPRKVASLSEIATQLIGLHHHPEQRGFVLSLKPETLLGHNPIELPLSLYKLPSITNSTSGLSTIPKFSSVGIHVRMVSLDPMAFISYYIIYSRQRSD